VVESNVRQRLDNLLAAIVNSMRLANERDNHVPIGGFVKDDFRMAGGNDLGALLRSNLGQELINLPLAQHLEVGVRLVQEQDGLGVRMEMGQQKQGLLQTASGTGQIQNNTRIFRGTSW
jgi:hypothetical protein